MFKIGSEAYEQEKVVKYLELHNYKFTCVPSDTYTKSWKQKKKNTLMWVRQWMSDLIILLKNKPAILFLEMKKARWKQWWLNWSVVSEFQLSWQEEINKVPSAQYTIAHWYEEAILEIESLEII